MQHLPEKTQLSDNAPEVIQPPEAIEIANRPSVIDRVTAMYDRYQQWAEENPVKATAAETIALYGLRKVVTAGARKLGVPTENAFIDEHVERASRHPIKGLAQATIIAPIQEEIAFRGILDVPARRAERAGNAGRARAYRAATTGLFALGHSGVVRPSESWPKAPFVSVKTEGATVPVEQLIGGANYQRLAKKRGFLHAVLGHAINNTLKSAELAPAVIKKANQQRR